MSGELIDKLVADVHRHGYMGAYRKGIVAGIRERGGLGPQYAPAHYKQVSILTFLKGFDVGREIYDAALLRASAAEGAGQ